MADLQDPIAIERSTMQAIADAVRTRTAQGGGGDTVPTGQIIMMMGKTAPTGYLACDGTVYNIADYAALATYFAAQFDAANYFGGDGETTFAVPDLRGEFLRGSGTNGHENQGSGADVGVHQDGTLHVKTVFSAGVSPQTLGVYYSSVYLDQWGNFSEINSDGSINSGGNTTTPKISKINVNSSSSTSSKANMFASRPTNTSVLVCIKT